MATTITAGATTITPALVLGYDTTTRAGNVMHQIIGSSAPAVTFFPESLRSGELKLMFPSRALAWAAQTFLKAQTIFTLASTDETLIGMKFVRDGSMSIALDNDMLEFWQLTVSYQEVP